MSLHPWCCTPTDTSGAGSLWESLDDPQGPWTTGRGGAARGLEGKNGDKHYTAAAGCSSIAALKNMD